MALYERRIKSCELCGVGGEKLKLYFWKAVVFKIAIKNRVCTVKVQLITEVSEVSACATSF